MNRRFGLSADATLKAAQALYEAKLITYPRTDSRYLGCDMKGKIPGILGELRALKPAEIGRLDLDALAFTGRIIDDAKVSDHHAIIPTGKRPGALSPAAAEGLRRRRRPPDRRLLPRLRQGGDDRLRGVERGAVPGQGRAGARAGLDGPVPPQARRRGGRGAGPARVPPRRERPARAVRQAGRDDPAEALHRGEPARGDGDGRQAGRRRGAEGGAQGEGPGHAGDAGGDHRDAARAGLHRAGEEGARLRRTWAATWSPWSGTGA